MKHYWKYMLPIVFALQGIIVSNGYLLGYSIDSLYEFPIGDPLALIVSMVSEIVFWLVIGHIVFQSHMEKKGWIVALSIGISILLLPLSFGVVQGLVVVKNALPEGLLQGLASILAILVIPFDVFSKGIGWIAYYVPMTLALLVRFGMIPLLVYVGNRIVLSRE